MCRKYATGIAFPQFPARGSAGTGGMLSVAEERLLERNKDARLRLYGQEINDQSYAICKSDMIVKGQDAGNIRLGDTLTDDQFFDRTFDFCMSNPPFGIDSSIATDRALPSTRLRWRVIAPTGSC